MGHGIGRAAGEVMGIEMGLLGDGAPFRVEQDQRGKAVGVDSLEDSGSLVSAGRKM